MRVSWNWLCDLVDTDRSPDDVAALLTLAGLEVESVSRLGSEFTGVVTAEIVEKQPHPRSQKLTLVKLTDGQGTHDVVCGASNVPARGGKVLWARPGARLPGGREIGQKELAGVLSAGMICSQVELAMGEDASGIVVLAGEDAAAHPGTTAQEALALTDVVLDINVTTNRADCLGHLGIAREVAAVTGGVLMRPSADLAKFVDARSIEGCVAVSVKDALGCPRYTARLIDGLTVAPSPRWLRRRLEAVGIRPISNVVDVTNYVMLELSQPLHAFDAARVRGAQIVVRPARPGERMKTLDGAERVLEASDLLICDAEGPMALAGVMGGAGSEISDATTRVLLESACFAPLPVRRTAKRLGLHSESSHRFERGVDPNGVEFASSRAARLLCELCGGRVFAGVVDVYPRPALPRVVDLRPARARALLGLDLEIPDMVRHLRALELEVPGDELGPDVETLHVTCPTFRLDLEREVDLIEEVARLHGFDAIPATLPMTQAAPSTPLRQLAEIIKDTLAAAGLSEAITYGFSSPSRLQAFALPADHQGSRFLTIKNPMREDHAILRTSLLPNLLAAMQRNLAFGLADVQLFEVGHVFWKRGDRALPDEPLHIAGVLCGARPGWLKPNGALEFFDAKGVLERLFAVLGMDVAFAAPHGPSECPGFHPGVSARVSVGGEGLGLVGEVHPDTREALGIERPCFAFELDGSRFPALPLRQGRAIPRYPAVVRDVSFFVDEALPAAQVMAEIRRSSPKILEEIGVLDDYRESGKVPLGKKSMLWSLTYRAMDRTLTDAEVDQVHEELFSRVLASLGAQRR